MTESNESKRLKGEAEGFADLFADIVNRRGGVEAFSQEQLRIARALTKELAGSDVDPTLCEKLSAMLPPVVSAVTVDANGQRHIDLERLTDDELQQLEVLVQKYVVPGPPPESNSPQAMLQRSFERERQWKEWHDRLEDQLRIEQGTSAMWERLQQSAATKCDELRAENARLREQLAKVVETAVAPGQQTTGERPSNVVRLGDGIAQSIVRC